MIGGLIKAALLTILLISTYYSALYINCPCIINHDLRETLSRLSSVTLVDWHAFSGIIYGAIGILLGYLFFRKRVIIDNINLKNDRIRNRLSHIYDQLNHADSIADLILDANFDNNDELNKARAKLDKTLMLISVYLDNNDKLIGLNEDELEAILQVHSFMINSDVMFTINHSELKTADRISIHLSYLGVIQEARTTCLQKMESL